MLRIGAAIGVALVAAASAFGASATPASVLDRTYSCRVRREPVEFVKWSPAKITGYLGKSCTDTS
jgi:hypothetical protein